MLALCFAALPVLSAWAGLGQGTTIPTSDSNILKGLSPLNWVAKGGSIHTSVGGASVTTGFTGTSHVNLVLDPAPIRFPAPGRFPIIAWQINGGTLQTHQLAAGDSSIPLADGVVNPVIDLYLIALSPFENRYLGDVPENSVKITGFQVDSGGRTAPAALPAKIWMNVGDSILSGDAALYAKGQGRPPDDGWPASDDARASYGYLLAHHYGYRESRVAYGGYDWAGGLANLPPLETLIDQITSVDKRLSGSRFNPPPAVVLINLGENGVPKAPDVIGALKKLRLRSGPQAKIVVMVPVSGKGRAALTDAFAAYKTSSHDKQAYLVDLGAIAFDTADGTHPTAAGHRAIYAAALPAFDKIIGK